MDLGLKGKVAVVTGAGRHIGRQIALTLADEGANVAVNDYYAERANEVAEEIVSKSGRAIPIKADVTKGQEVEEMIARVVDEFGRVDILINNAGIMPVEVIDQNKLIGFRKSTIADWDNTIGVNIYGVFNCSRAVLDQMCNQKYGKIVNIMSDAGRVGDAGLVAYSAAKAAMAGFSKALAKEVGRFCINVNCVSLGFYPGPSTREKIAKTQEEYDRFIHEQTKKYPLTQGLGRFGIPTDAAYAVAFMASDTAAWITGQILSVSGGMSMVD